MCTSQKLDEKSNNKVKVLDKEKFKLSVSVHKDEAMMKLQLELVNMDEKQANKDAKDHFIALTTVVDGIIQYYHKKIKIQE